MTWTDFAPFTDWKGFVRLLVGVTIVLLVLKFTGARRFVA